MSNFTQSVLEVLKENFNLSIITRNDVNQVISVENLVDAVTALNYILQQYKKVEVDFQNIEKSDNDSLDMSKLNLTAILSVFGVEQVPDTMHIGDVLDVHDVSYYGGSAALVNGVRGLDAISHRTNYNNSNAFDLFAGDNEFPLDSSINSIRDREEVTILIKMRDLHTPATRNSYGVTGIDKLYVYIDFDGSFLTDDPTPMDKWRHISNARGSVYKSSGRGAVNCIPMRMNKLVKTYDGSGLTINDSYRYEEARGSDTVIRFKLSPLTRRLKVRVRIVDDMNRTLSYPGGSLKAGSPPSSSTNVKCSLQIIANVIPSNSKPGKWQNYNKDLGYLSGNVVGSNKQNYQQYYNDPY